MASQLHTQNFPQIQNYDTAVLRYARRAEAFPIKARTHGFLPLGLQSQRDCKLWKDHSDTIHVRYHSTDVISYYASGEVVLRRYMSRNTEQLVNTVLDGAVQVAYENQPLGYGYIILPRPEHPRVRGYVSTLRADEARIYALGRYADTVRLQYTGEVLTLVEPDQATQPIQRPFVNRKAANARYRQHRLEDFTLFCEAQRKLGVLPSSLEATTVDFPYRSPAARLEMLQDQAHWQTLYKVYGADAPAQLRVDVLRQYPDTIEIETLPWVAGTEVDRILRAQRSYAWRLS